MGKFKHDVQVSLCDAIGVILITALFGLCWFGFYDEKLYAPFHLEGWCVVALFCLVYCLLCRAYNAFDVALQGVSEAVYSQALSILFSDVIFYGVTCLLARAFVDLRPILATFAVQLLGAVIWCGLKRKWYFAAFLPKRSVIVSARVRTRTVWLSNTVWTRASAWSP